MCANEAEVGASVGSSPTTSASDGSGSLHLRNLIVVDSAERTHAVFWAEDTDIELGQSAISGALGPAVHVVRGHVDVDQSLLLWPRDQVVPQLVINEGSLGLSTSQAWPAPDRSLFEIDGEPGDMADRLIDHHPHLRGALRDREQALRCEIADYHPRPLSPGLLQGWPAEEGDPVLGPFGGEARIVDDWRRDADGDGTPAIFDCDDHDPSIGPWLVQYVDEDGDGIGGELWEGDDCDLVPGNVLIGGDCDDQDQIGRAHV